MGTRTLSVTFTRVLALAVAFMLAIVALPAFAATGAGNINPDQTGSIAVHKLSEPTVAGTAGTGEQVTNLPVDSKKLKGIQFSLQKIEGLDLKTDAGWKKLQEVTALINGSPAKAANVAITETPGLQLVAPAGAGNDAPKETDVEGLVTFSDLPVGAYLVTEGDDNGNNSISGKAAPFIVTIPFPVTTGNGWKYDVHVYPKNPVSTVEKVVADADATKLGDTMKWYVSFDIPKQTTITSFKFEDKVDVQTTYKALKAAILPANTLKANLATAFANGTELPLTQFDNVGLLDTGRPAVDDTPGTVVATISAAKNAAALNELKKDEHKGKKLVFELTVTIDHIKKDGSGLIENKEPGKGGAPWAKGYFNDSPNPVSPTGDGAPEPSKWGTIDVVAISKTNGNTENPLKGVEFKVYKDKEAAKRAAAGNPQPSDERFATFTTGDNGKGDFTLRTGEYYIVQTGTPAGFNKLPEPIHFDLTGNHKVTQYPNLDDKTGGTDIDGDWKIEIPRRTPGGDAASNLPNLPVTGAAGQLLLGLAGGAVLLGAAGTFMLSARRKHQG